MAKKKEDYEKNLGLTNAQLDSIRSANPLNIPQFPSLSDKLKSAEQKNNNTKDTQNTQKAPPEINRIYTDSNTGQPSGFDFNGQTYFGAKPSEIAAAKEAITARNQPANDLLAFQQQQDLAVQQDQLQQRQTAELNQFRQDTAPKTAEDVTTRNVRAGVAFSQALLTSVGIMKEAFASSKDIDVSKKSGAFKTGATIIGKVGTLGYGRVRISSLIDTSGNIRNLQSDAGEAVRFSNAQLALALTRSESRPKANIDDAIANARTAESAIRMAYSQAQNSLKLSPGDIADGLDLTDAMRTDLGIAIQNRQMLERYRITQDPTEITNAIAGQYDLP